MSIKTTVALAFMTVAACNNAASEPPVAPPAEAPPPEAASAAAAPAPSTPAADSGSAASDQLTPDESADFCVRIYEQVQPCAGEFADLLVELRQKYFPDFAAKTKDAKALAAFRAEAKKEVVADGSGTPEERRQRCKQSTQHGPPTPRGVVPQMEACFAKTSCKEKMDCMRPVMDDRFRARGAAPSQ